MSRLADEHRELLELTRRYAREELAPHAAETERSGRFPRDRFAALGQLGLAGLPMPADVGGGEVPYPVYLQVLETLARAHVTVALAVSVHTLSMTAVDAFGTPDQRARLLPPMTAGEHLGAYCLSEPDAGSDAAALSCRARRDSGDYRLDGTKAWVTHGGVADTYVVFARTGGEGSRGISAFAVDADQPGLAVAKTEDKMGLTGSPTAQLTFEDAVVPADRLLGAEEGTGFRIAMSALDGGRLGIAAIATGLAQAALDEAVAYAREREQFGQPIVRFQGVGFLLADMATRIAAGRSLYRDAAERRDAGEPGASAACSMAKLFCTDTAMAVTTDAVQVLGGVGYTRELPAERYMREAKVMQIFEGTNQVQRLVISRHLERP